MNPMIEFCTNNYIHGTDKIKQKLEDNPEYDVIEYNCLGHCERCAVTPFAVVEGEFIEADDPDDLIVLIEETIEERKAFDNLFDQL
ncbi:MAG: YuzB family protein [Tepidibacillus sp.]|uniref:YuzB family protein n=1 Tax=Tepidibacillus sp. HK-1 TaxID=1883407 RepID=UPI000853BA09|nr:YuzB family protein [Tepidibacillus sp. HK-1]GBF10303.1 hypothetical protein HK1_00315 [Tepidibacillus sp. HK-1]